jgi:hypothetical protein
VSSFLTAELIRQDLRIGQEGFLQPRSYTAVVRPAVMLCDNHTVAAVAIVPFWHDLTAHGPVKVINDQGGAVHPRRPFIVLTW